MLTDHTIKTIHNTTHILKLLINSEDAEDVVTNTYKHREAYCGLVDYCSISACTCLL